MNMLREYSRWISLLYLLICSIQFIETIDQHRENLALRHPCNSINKRLEPYIKWTEKLASSQYGAAKDACGHTGSSPACCTNEIVNSYALALGHDLKVRFDTRLRLLREFLHQSAEHITEWKKTYIVETRRITKASLERLFGREEYQSHLDATLTNLFHILDQDDLSSDDVSKSSVNLFNQLILSLYRHFMSEKTDEILSDQFEKCLIKKAFDIEALPKQRELLYTLTSGASLIHVLQNLFIYLDADIQRMNESVTLHSNPCLQRYARETLCPICVHMPSTLWSQSNHRDDMINGPLCENDCRFVVKTCFDSTTNPYMSFASMIQGYTQTIEQIQDATNELKLVERLGKFHIYLYDMIVNATNTEQTYVQLQRSCPNNNSKPFSRIRSVQAITSERRDLIQQWNNSLHFLLDQLKHNFQQLNESLSDNILTDICSNSKYAMKSSQCTKIDQHTPGFGIPIDRRSDRYQMIELFIQEDSTNLSQWPLPPPSSSIPFDTTLNAELIRNQLNELKKKINPVQQMIISLRPKKKLPLVIYIPEFDSYDTETNNYDHEHQHSSVISDIESYDNDPHGSLSERLYNEIDGHLTTRRSTVKTTKSSEKIRTNLASSSSMLTHHIVFNALICSLVILILQRISFNCQ